LTLVPAHAARLFKVVDQDGNVSYQARPAPLDPGVISEEKDFNVGKGKAGGSMATIARKNPIVIYSAPNCGSCTNARKYLDGLKIPYTDKNAQGNQKVAEELRKVSGALTVPVITIGKKVLSGYTEPWLESELGKVGYPVPKKQTVSQ
jgi:glutaredoxin